VCDCGTPSWCADEETFPSLEGEIAAEDEGEVSVWTCTLPSDGVGGLSGFLVSLTTRRDIFMLARRPRSRKGQRGAKCSIYRVVCLLCLGRVHPHRSHLFLLRWCWQLWLSEVTQGQQQCTVPEPKNQPSTSTLLPLEKLKYDRSIQYLRSMIGALAVFCVLCLTNPLLPVRDPG